jgi:hypothetical protein
MTIGPDHWHGRCWCLVALVLDVGDAMGGTCLGQSDVAMFGIIISSIEHDPEEIGENHHPGLNHL